MKTPTIASPARMSESTYSKFTLHLPFVAANNLADNPVIASECAPDRASATASGGTSQMHSCLRNLCVTQLRARSAFLVMSRSWIEDGHGNDVARSAVPQRPRRCQEA